jgi:predicted SAM-dependent methyltransferase
MKLLNLGCGTRHHPDWTNVDFISTGEGVIAYDLKKGIPFDNNLFDVVYHSHVLEHFPKNEAKSFITECYRVLKPGGIMRVAVPDLERIVREYLIHMEGALNGSKESAQNYEWIMLELYDQTVRSYSGGAMAEYLFQPKIENEEYVFQRVGEEARRLRHTYLQQQAVQNKVKPNVQQGEVKRVSVIQRVVSAAKKRLKCWFFKEELKEIRDKEGQLKQKEYAQSVGEFRLQGEIHQWMYDRFSLNKLLTESGFSKFRVTGAGESQIDNWHSYDLEINNGVVIKPDSLFAEVTK